MISTQKNQNRMKKLLSIIIPVYNVEKYIRSCVNSLLKQDIDKEYYEIILIDDGTPDNSFGVIEDLIKQNTNINVFHQKNKGPSAARNLGVKKAKGEYILFVDSDDLLNENSIREILDIAIETKADLVVADYLVQNEEDRIITSIKQPTSLNISIKNGHELFLEDLDPNECYVWRTLYRKRYLENIGLQFYEGISFEDVPYLQECYLKAGKCVKINFPIYIYRKRHNTLSSAINKKTILDINQVIAKLWKLAELDNISHKERERIKDNTFITFSLNLWYISHIKSILPERKELVEDLKNKVPNIWFKNGLKQLFVSIMFRYFPSIYLKVRSYV